MNKKNKPIDENKGIMIYIALIIILIIFIISLFILALGGLTTLIYYHLGKESDDDNETDSVHEVEFNLQHEYCSYTLLKNYPVHAPVSL